MSDSEVQECKAQIKTIPISVGDRTFFVAEGAYNAIREQLLKSIVGTIQDRITLYEDGECDSDICTEQELSSLLNRIKRKYNYEW